MASSKLFAFILMPFDAAFDDVYKLGIQDAAASLDVVAERVNERPYADATILQRIYNQIDAADFVIADMTNRNPNVFYEVGYTHAKSKLCTLLTQKPDDIPFDLKLHRHLVYRSVHDLRSQLVAEIAWLKEEVAKRKSEPLTAELSEVSSILLTSDFYADAQIELTFDLHNRSGKRSPEIEAIYFHTGDGWTFRQQGGHECPTTRSEAENYRARHFVASPVPRLSPGGWAQVKLVGLKRMWSKALGDGPMQESYRITGKSLFEVQTSERSVRHAFPLDLRVDEIPF